MEAAAIQVAIAGTILCNLFTLLFIPKTPETTFNLEILCTAFWVLGLVVILAIQFVSANQGKKLGILSGRRLNKKS